MVIATATAAPVKRTKRNIALNFQPGDEQAFLRAAIKGGRVLLTPVLANGTTLEPSTWVITRLSEKSNLRNNIFSRTAFRAGVLDSRVTTIRVVLNP